MEGSFAQCGIKPHFNEGNLAHRFLGVLTNDRNKLSRRDVVARFPVIIERRRVEVFGQNFLPSRESVAAIHSRNYARVPVDLPRGSHPRQCWYVLAYFQSQTKTRKSARLPVNSHQTRSSL